MTNEYKAIPRLLQHLKPFRTGQWDAAVLRRTRLCLLDSLACHAAGRALPHSLPSSRVARELFGVTSPFAAAYLYSQAANALDYDDTLFGHPGAPIVGTVLAVGARRRLSADRVLRGIAAGYEAHAIICAAAAPSRERAAQVRSVGVWDTVAASIGAGVALGLDDSMMHRVIGLAATHSILPYTAKWYERPAPALKNNLGWVAAGAVLSLELGAAGMSGVTAALDGDAGMWRMAGSDQWALGPSLTDKPAVLRTGFKHYPACWHLQEHLKAFSHLLSSIPAGNEVTEILVASTPDIAKFCPPDLRGTADVAFSLPATFSLLMAGVEPGPQWAHFDGTAPMPAFRYERSDYRTIRVHTRNGLQLEAAVGHCDGADIADGGLDEAGVLAKHDRLADPRLHPVSLAGFGPDAPTDEYAVPDSFYMALRRVLSEAPGALASKGCATCPQ